MAQVLQNVRVGLRALRRTPGFALTGILTLAVGIGLATAVFAVAEALLLRPLPIRDQNRVVVLWGAARDGSVANFPLLLPEARDFATRARSLERVEFFSLGGAYLGADPRRQHRLPPPPSARIGRLFPTPRHPAAARPGLEPRRRRHGRGARRRPEPRRVAALLRRRPARGRPPARHARDRRGAHDRRRDAARAWTIRGAPISGPRSSRTPGRWATTRSTPSSTSSAASALAHRRPTPARS